MERQIAGDWSGMEAMAMAKMGRQGVKGSRGGLGVAGEALWRRGDSRRRPAVETNQGAGARVTLGQN